MCAFFLPIFSPVNNKPIFFKKDLTNSKKFAASGQLEEKSSIVNTGGLNHEFCQTNQEEFIKTCCICY